jgi:exonuclease SbcD
VKLLHAADLHIDSPLRGLEKYQDAPADTIRAATRRAMENLVAVALDEQVDAVLLAGDIYDGDWRNYDTGLFFQRQLGALAEADIPVYLVSGNHDADSQISKNLTLPRNVHQFATHRAESVPNENLGLVVHGQGYVRRDVTENLAADYPRALPGLFNVGLLHTALTGREGHANYAPCTVNQLASRDYGYWALGHVHTREVVATEPHIVFPGNIQGRHARETGSKGCTLVTVEMGRVSVEHRELDVVRWAHVQVDASSADDLDDVCELARDQLALARDQAAGRLLAARVSMTGRSAAHAELWRNRERLTHELRGIAFDLGEVWVEKVRPATQPPDSSGGSGLADSAEVIDGLLRTAKELGADPDAVRRLVEKDPLWGKLPHEARGEDRINPNDPRWCEDLLAEASDLLVAMLEERTR